MKEWHRELVKLKTTTSLTLADIGKTLGKSRATITRAMQNPEILDQISSTMIQNDADFASLRKDLILKSWQHFKDVLDNTDFKKAFPIDKTKVGLEVLKGCGELKEHVDAKIEPMEIEIRYIKSDKDKS